MRAYLAIVALVLAACGPVVPDSYTIDDLPAPEDLEVTWGCGHGFWVSDRGEEVSLRIAYHGEGAPASEVTLPDPEWDATLAHGTDLYANWCDDVIEDGEPVPIEHWTLPVVAGHLRLVGPIPAPFTGGPLTVKATGLEVELPDGGIGPLGDITITNPSWGFFAG